MTDELMKQVLLGMAGAFGSTIVGLLWKLVASVTSLNQKMAVICATVEGHDKRIYRLESNKP